jgi:predicted Zn-dependent protease
MSMPSDGARFAGLITDGRTAGSRAATIRIAGGGLELRTEDDHKTRIWPYDELSSSVPLRADAPDALLSLGAGGAETLFVNNPTFASVVLARAPHLSPMRRRWQGLKPGLAVVAAVAAVIGGVWGFDLQPSQAVARVMPLNARQALGDAVVRSLAKDRKVCETPASKAALGKLTSRLLAAAPGSPPNVRVLVLDWPLVNAFAVPGGQIILTKGLIQHAGTPDEVAGVLAHELGHAVEMHPEAGIIRYMGLSAAAQLAFAGSSGTMTNVGVVLTALRYSRVAEREADAHALNILKGAGISQKGFADFFERLEDKPPAGGGASNGKLGDFSVLSTHPQTAERIAMVRARPAYAATPALSDEDWTALGEACGPLIRPRPPAAAPAAQRPAPSPAPTTPAPAPAPTKKRTAAGEPPPPSSAHKSPQSGPLTASAEPPPQPAQAPAPSPSRPASSTSAPLPPASSPRIDPQADREIAEAGRALASDPRDTEALQRRARAHSRKGEYAAALADYTSAVEMRPQDAELHYGRGTALQNLRRYEEAISAYDETLRLAPNHSNARNNRGNVNRVLKRYEAALKDFDEVIRAQPEFLHGLYNRGLVYREMDRLEEAVRDFTATLARDKSYTAAYTSRGIAHERMGARDKAIEDFRTALTVPAKYSNGAWAHNTARERLKTLGVAAQ